MESRFRLVLAQVNPLVGDVAGNLALLRRTQAEAEALGADLILAPELVVSGYPPEDLVLKPAFQAACRAAILDLTAATSDGPALLVGTPWVEEGRLHNACLLLAEGRIASRVFKHELPNYGVFDEKRVFAPGPLPTPIPFRGANLGVMVCEDLWFPNVARHLKAAGADLLLVPNGSPFERGKDNTRLAIAEERCRETGLPIVYLNQIGGQDELVFDGDSFVLGAAGDLRCRLPAFASHLTPTDWTKGERGWVCAPAPIAALPDEETRIYSAMMLGLRDYVTKNRFPGIILGLSGGIDSALSAAIAADALGPERVRAVMLPSPYTSDASLEDAASVAERLGILYDVIPIEPAMHVFDNLLRDLFAGHKPDTTEENIQSRARGLILMALSNKFGAMLMTTGNKSEMSVGYATLYGDMCGGFSALKDVYKVDVFRLARWRNAHRPPGALGPEGPVMPDRVIARAPSAELRPDQTDQDSLPPYEILDAILEFLVEREMNVDEIVAKGYSRETVLKVWRLLDLAEYKRRQAPPGVKISRRAFGRDRRYPITNGFRAG